MWLERQTFNDGFLSFINHQNTNYTKFISINTQRDFWLILDLAPVLLSEVKDVEIKFEKFNLP